MAQGLDGARDGDKKKAGDLPEGGKEALETLRNVWTATGEKDQSIVQLECGSEGTDCSTSLGFEGFAEFNEPTFDTEEASKRLQEAWKSTLKREGKLHTEEESSEGS